MPDTKGPIAVIESAAVDDTPSKEQMEAVHVEAVVSDDCPDGGLRAWLVVFGVFCGLCATVGLVNAWGTFQAYYQEVKLSNRSSSDIAWIGSVQNAMLYVPGLALGRLFDRGHLRLPVLAASAVFVVCMFLTAECTQFWHFLLCQGFGLGLAGGVLFDMGNMILAHWFKRRLGFALACVFGGASIGGCIFPMAVKALLQRTSFPWTMRILGFLTLGLLVVTNLTIARRLPGTRDLGPLINIAEFKNPSYSFYVASLIVNMLALFTVLTYLTVSAVEDNIDADLSFDLLTIANATFTLGRIASGLFADRFGPLNVLIPATLATAAVTYAWPFATSVPAFVTIAVLIGLSTGAILAILVQTFAHMGALDTVGLRIGMGLSLVTAGVLAGPPIAGAIVDRTRSFAGVGFYGGSTLLFSAALMGAARRYMVVMVRDSGALE